MQRIAIIITALLLTTGCSAISKVAFKATPSLRDPSRFEYSVEFNK